MTGCDLLEWHPHPERAKYYDTLQEAIAHSKLKEEVNTITIDEVLALSIDGQYGSLVFLSSSYGKTDIYACMLYIDQSDGVTRYSAPFLGSDTSWALHKFAVEKGQKDDYEEIAYSMFMPDFNFDKKAMGIENTKHFYWGLSQTERVKHLSIDGQPVTKVIEIDFDGERAYFWYFDDLNLDEVLSTIDETNTEIFDRLITFGDE
jgi:hypothetical protein